MNNIVSIKNNNNSIFYKVERDSQSFTLNISYDTSDDCWIGVVQENDVSSFGSTEQQALKFTLEALDIYLEWLRESWLRQSDVVNNSKLEFTQDYLDFVKELWINTNTKYIYSEPFQYGEWTIHSYANNYLDEVCYTTHNYNYKYKFSVLDKLYYKYDIDGSEILEKYWEGLVTLVDSDEENWDPYYSWDYKKLRMDLFEAYKVIQKYKHSV